MEEKIIEATFSKNKLARTLLAIGLIIAACWFAAGTKYALSDEAPWSWFWDNMGEFGDDYGFVLAPCVLLVLASFFFSWKMSRCALSITNRRVCGKASFGRAVDLPLNQISAVGLGSCNRITVGTSSGKINFYFVENRSDVYRALTDLIGKVQIEAAYAQNSVSSASNADELKKYKDLLDGGVITQEEFDAKKKQLLGL